MDTLHHDPQVLFLTVASFSHLQMSPWAAEAGSENHLLDIPWGFGNLAVACLSTDRFSSNWLPCFSKVCFTLWASWDVLACQSSWRQFDDKLPSTHLCWSE